MAAHESACHSSLRAIVDDRGEGHGRRKDSRAGLRLHARPVRSEPSPCLRLHTPSPSMLAVKLERPARRIAGCRRDQLDFGDAELDLLRRGRAVQRRGVVVEGEGPLSGRAVSVQHDRSDSHGVANKGSRVARASDDRWRRKEGPKHQIMGNDEAINSRLMHGRPGVQDETRQAAEYVPHERVELLASKQLTRGRYQLDLDLWSV